jgi:hypothetical protein
MTETKKALLQNRIIYYIDILGFKELIHDENYEKAELLSGLVKGWKNAYEEISKSLSISYDDWPEITLFSDTIVVSRKFPCDNKLINGDLKTIDIFRSRLMFFDMYIRGAISIGELHHCDNTSSIYGKGLIEAYKSEEALANYPRIIISPESYKLIPSKILKDYFKRDKDGLSYLKFRKITSPFFEDSDKISSPKDVTKHIINLITQQSKQTNPKVRIKHEWLLKTLKDDHFY